MINLEAKINPLLKSDVDFFDVREHKFYASKVVHRMGIVNAKREIDDNTLQLLLARLPLPKVYFCANADGSNEVVKGHELVNTLTTLLYEHGVCGPRSLERRLEEAEIDCVVLSAGMSDEMRSFMLKILGVTQ
jgi:hypothetical protein